MPVITTSSAWISDGLTELDGSILDGSIVVSSTDGSGISGWALRGGSTGYSRCSGAMIGCSSSVAFGPSASFVACAFLLGFAWPLKRIWTSQYNDKDIKVQKKDIYYYPGAVLKAGSWVCDESPEEEREISRKDGIKIEWLTTVTRW